MTCVIAVEYDGDVYMGFDSLGAGSFSYAATRIDAKGWLHRSEYNFVIGGTTSYRMLQLLRYHATPPNPYEDHREWTEEGADEWWQEWMVTKYVPGVRKVLKEHGWSKTDNGQEEGGLWLVGVDGRVFAIDADFQVRRTTHGYQAVGCGGLHATGALYALEQRDGQVLPSHIEVALAAAQEHGAGVREPFFYVDTVVGE